MAANQASAGDIELLDEEYLHHVTRGTDLLARGDAEAAAVALGRARQLQPADTRVLGLLGQALYRLGKFEEASEAFQSLVDRSPMEAAPRVNLGLARLKARSYPEAIRQLELALQVQPGHKRALGYLGLAYLEHGDPVRARDCFVRAGSDAMVARCDETLAQTVSTPLPSLGAPEEDALAAVPQLAIRPDTPFGIDRGFVVTRVAGDVFVRTEGLTAVRGQVRLGRAAEQQRGQPTDRSFGEGPRRMLRASGTGAMVHSMPGKRLSRLELDGTRPACLSDAVLFAFEGGLAYDNGRVASRLGSDLDLVQLRGRGQVLLASRGDLALVAVAPDASLRVPVAALAGWLGGLTPHFGPLLDLDRGAVRSEAAPLAVELSGSGYALLEGSAA